MTKNQILTEKDNFSNILLIDENGRNQGIVSVQTALEFAKKANLDPVIVSPTDKQPVCKLINYKKMQYDSQKKEKQVKKNQKTQKNKEIRINYVIGDSDLKVKISKISKFLDKGHRVKVVASARGIRDVSRAKDVLDYFIDEIQNIITSPFKVDGDIKKNNFDFVMNLLPEKEKADAPL